MSKVVLVYRLESKACNRESYDELFNALTYFKEIQDSLELDFSDNYIPDSYMENLSSFLTSHKSISNLSLNLRGNAITDGGIKKLCEGIQKLSNLKHLNVLLDYNYWLTDISVQYIGKSVSSIKGMVQLNLSIQDKTYVTEAGKELLKNSVKDNSTLSKVILNRKDIFAYI